MSINKDVIVPNAYYHIYNQAVGNEKLFLSEEHYYYFLGLFHKYIFPVAHTFSYSLVPNRYDFLILIRHEYDIWQQMKKLNYRHINIPEIEHVFLLQQFSNFLNAYTKAFNKQQNRKGRLFIGPFSRDVLTAFEKFTSIIIDMHFVPVRKGLCKTPDEWPFTSFRKIKENHPQWMQAQTVLDWFGSKEAFIKRHEAPLQERFESYRNAGAFFSGYWKSL